MLDLTEETVPYTLRNINIVIIKNNCSLSLTMVREFIVWMKNIYNLQIIPNSYCIILSNYNYIKDTENGYSDLFKPLLDDLKLL